jgi:hypothetical protein
MLGETTLRTKLICFALLAVGLVGSVSMPGAAQTNTSPYRSRPFVMDGVITQVDGRRDRLVITGSNGRAYTLDMAEADITLLDGNRAGMTPDLSRGMRVHVTGRQISSGIAEVGQLRVLEPPPPAFSRPRGPVVPQGPAALAVGEDIQLRGTVDTIDTRRGVFVIRVRDHTRAIYLAGDTDLSGLALRDPARFPVKPGDRVTVAGRLQPDGGVLAGAVSLSRTLTLPVGVTHPDRILFGRITSTSNRFTSRNIKIRLADNREVKIKVRRGLVIRRGGRPISVHDLRDGDDVRVTGSFDGRDFKADRLDVLYRDKVDEGTDAPGPTRGL